MKFQNSIFPNVWVAVFAIVFCMLLGACDDSASADGETSNNNSSSLNAEKCEYGTLVDSIDGLTYKTVKIGNQVWMAENFGSKTGDFCYDDDAENCTKYGRLYTWFIARSVCPNGWHLPSKKEFETLLGAVGGTENSAKKLKSSSGWDENGNGQDAFCFSALPAGKVYLNETYGGVVDPDKRFLGIRTSATFWSSTEDGPHDYVFDRLSNAMSFDLYSGLDFASFGSNSKLHGRSVRCVKD
jgi:uncharacterized protein (TIGR02145 family)